MTRIVSKQNFVSPSIYLILIIVVSFIIVAYHFTTHTALLDRFGYRSNTSSAELSPFNRSRFGNHRITPARTLVIYVYGKTHVSAEKNLVFFIQHAVRHSDHADYYFILQQIDKTSFDETKLPVLPPNAHYIQHENKCFDIGTVGWFLSSGMIDRTRYKYFIFLNSSVRGPFIVSYYESTTWYTIFTRRLNDHIKLVGCTINCESAPHVQSYLWTLNLETLDFLLKNKTIFVCYGSKNDAINNAEIGASQILLKSGYGIDSLMTKYRGVDFRLNITEKCSNKLNPVFDKGGGNDLTLDPYEVVFVKTKEGTPPYHDNFQRVHIYEKWLH